MWEDYRERRRLFWFSLLVCFPCFPVIGIPLWLLFQSDVPISILAGAWLTLFVVAGTRLGSFPCPRCGRPFFKTWWYNNGLATRCLHCGLPKWSEPPFDEAGSAEPGTVAGGEADPATRG
jgi:hypothetical protein